MGIIVNGEIQAAVILADKKLQAKFIESVDSYMKAGLYGPDGLPIPREQGIKYLQQKLQAATQYPPEAMKPPKPVVVKVDEDVVPEYDDRWMRIFNTIQSTSESETYESGEQSITFEELKPGARVKFTHMASGKTVTVRNVTYAAGIALLKVWFEDNKWWKIEDATRKAKEQAVVDKAAAMYGLIKKTNYDTVAYATSWIKTLNTAWAKLLRKLKKDSIRKPVVIAPVEVAAELIQAKKDSTVAGQRGERLTFDFDIIDTVHYDPTGPVDLVIPKKDQYYQHRQSLQVDRDFDITSQEILLAYTERYNGVVLSNKYGIRITL
ncbi:MAG TPA: hypothetical protein DEP48_02900 [Persephonella sp.]|uniref:Uncharacterized protein n=1 Tax=Persephonella marina (strain DSM 14350 / EX-H1) TaxID=123214 RepID=C0QS97_PERMH|nr:MULTISPECIES: hypothetical protein [Persephonella]ACO04306.1 hypothetical protein PERMA_1780 [Persephonella marina EX-H1]HCB69286.1 hypothetical protein [Persephonella sp.]